jgi:hypothetical protein
MKKIDFTKLQVPQGLAGLKNGVCKPLNIAKSLGNMIYQNTAGIAAKRLAEKIFDSTGEIDLNEEEERILKMFVDSSVELLLPIKDGIEMSLKEESQREINKVSKPIKK